MNLHYGSPRRARKDWYQWLIGRCSGDRHVLDGEFTLEALTKPISLGLQYYGATRVSTTVR